jgi:hypothetical protein
MRCSHEALPKTFPLPRFKLYWSMFAKKIGAKGKSQKNIQKKSKFREFHKKQSLQQIGSKLH